MDVFPQFFLWSNRCPPRALRNPWYVNVFFLSQSKPLRAQVKVDPVPGHLKVKNRWFIRAKKHYVQVGAFLSEISLIQKSGNHLVKIEKKKTEPVGCEIQISGLQKTICWDTKNTQKCQPKTCWPILDEPEKPPFLVFFCSKPFQKRCFWRAWWFEKIRRF